ncbi:MAG: GNAT family N-acetyltransferase [Nanoarchaeota archaeon]|nr:GNAT family N-acetyltransferase [Nanoarchaeota archaeon]
MEYEIINGSLEDLSEIVKLNMKIFKGMYESEPYSLEQYHSKLEDKIPIINVAKMGNEIVGDSIAFQKEDSLYLWVLGVSKDHRNKKIASQLFDLLEDFARKQELSVSVKTYPVSNEMIRLLKKRGYEIIKTDDSGAIHFRLDL